jgi:hypothetical protein
MEIIMLESARDYILFSEATRDYNEFDRKFGVFSEFGKKRASIREDIKDVLKSLPEVDSVKNWNGDWETVVRSNGKTEEENQALVVELDRLEAIKADMEEEEGQEVYCPFVADFGTAKAFQKYAIEEGCFKLFPSQSGSGTEKQVDEEKALKLALQVIENNA